MQDIKQERITAVQLLILMFVTRISSVIMYPGSFGGQLSVWSLMLPLLISILTGFIIVLPIMWVSRYEKQGLIKPLYDGKVLPVILIIISLYRGMSDLYRLNGFSIEYGGRDISQFFIVVLIFAAAFYGAVRGIEGLVRFAALVFIWIALGSIIITAGLLPSFDIDTIGKYGNFSSGESLKFLPLAVSDGGELILLMCFIDRIRGRVFSKVMMWNSFQGIFLIIMLILVSGSMGIYLRGVTFPFYHITEGSGSLQRLHPVFIGIVISAFVCRLGACLIIIRESIKSLSSDEKTVSRIFPIFAAIIIVGVVILSRNPDTAEKVFNSSIMFFSIVITTIIIPFIRLAKVRNKNIGKRGTAAVLSVIIFCFVFTGCRSIPLNQRIIIQGIGVDRLENEFEITLLTLDTDAENSEKAVKIIRGTGGDIEQAKEQIEKSTGKRCLFSQCLFIMMNREAASDHENTLNFFCENKEIIKTLNLIVSDENCNDLLTYAAEKKGYHSEDINMVTDSSVIDSSRTHCTLFDYISGSKERIKVFEIPIIETDRKTGQLISEDSFAMSL